VKRENHGVRVLLTILLATLALGLAVVVLAAADVGPFGGDEEGSGPVPAGERKRVDRFDSARAWRLLREQVELGPRPAGSAKSRALARRLHRMVPRGRYQKVPGGLRNVIGTVPGREPRSVVVVGAHYDTKDIPGFVGANDGASGTAVVAQIARSLRPRTIRPTVVFIFFDGEESPAGTPDSKFRQKGLRGSKVAARTYSRAEAMILLDFVGERNLSIPREEFSDSALWSRLRAAARAVGREQTFPSQTRSGIFDDHVPFSDVGVPSIDLIDFYFPCFHETCDDLSEVSEDSLDATGETVVELLRRL
jgi:hypothetical protein